jgi:hypothetical protein
METHWEKPSISVRWYPNIKENVGFDETTFIWYEGEVRSMLFHRMQVLMRQHLYGTKGKLGRCLITCFLLTHTYSYRNDLGET